MWLTLDANIYQRIHNVIILSKNGTTQICERHYARLSPNYVANTIRANFPNLKSIEESNLIPSVEKDGVSLSRRNIK